MPNTVRPVVLSGGAGTRLWPLSTPELPKQFLDLVGSPLIVQALARLDGLQDVADPVVVTGADHTSLVRAAVAAGSGVTFLTIVEPVGRNTAPAVLAAALSLDPEEIMVVLPADHLIDDREGFITRVAAAVDLAAEGKLVTFGVVPTRPDTGYGYIEIGAPVSTGFEVASFIEKPDAMRAAAMIERGNHLWNSGIFMFRAGSVLEEARSIAPELVTDVEAAMSKPRDGVLVLDDVFRSVCSISLDHAVMEHTSSAVVVSIDVGWSDLGSWQSLWEASKKDDDGNVIIGRARVSEVTGSYIHSSRGDVAVAGLDDVVVVAADDAVLVVPRSESQQVKGLAPDAGAK